MSGGAGYVLSKEALKIFVENGILDQNSNVCGKRLNIPEDVQMGKCLETLKVFNYNLHLKKVHENRYFQF